MAFIAVVTNTGMELLAQHDMGERIIGSPVPARDCIFIRGAEHLFCLASPETGE
jgi:hypothetical protein